MRLTSPAFENGDLIPRKYTCNGDNLSPPLTVREIPATTESLALVMDDPDAPGGTFVHWVVYDMPPTADIAEGRVTGTLGVNGFRKSSYGGPCPPVGVHRYFFKLYALDERLALGPGRSKAELLNAMEGHVVDSAELVGRYGSP